MQLVQLLVELQEVMLILPLKLQQIWLMPIQN